MNKLLMLAGIVLASSVVAACGEKKADEAAPVEAPAAEAAAPADAMAAPADEAADPAVPAEENGDDRGGNDTTRGVR